jgi:hypothetical protein
MTSHHHRGATSRPTHSRSIRLAAAAAVAAAAFSLAAAPASARIRDSVWLSATPTAVQTGYSATVSAQTNIWMDLNRFIYIYDVEGTDAKVCQAATTCTMTVVHSPPPPTGESHRYVAEVRQFGLGGFGQPYQPSAGEQTIATSNAVTVMWGDMS